MDKEKISIIIPCYNVENLVKRCLDSIFAQTVESVNYEVICVDDKSTDRTLEVLLSYEAQNSENMTIIPLEENGKQGRARNIALDYAAGEYIMYVDADDVIADGMLEALYQALIKYQCDVAECAYKSFTDEPDLDVETIGGIEFYDMGDVKSRKECILNHFLKTAPWGRLYKRELLKLEDVFFPEYITMEDTYFSELCMAHMQRYVYIPDTYYFYYINSDGTFHSAQAIDYYMDAVQVQNWATDRIIEEKLLEGCKQEWEYIHIYKAFRDPMLKMLNNKAFFSYSNYVKMFSEMQKRYPDAAENIYIVDSTTVLMSFVREIMRELYGKRALAILMYGERYMDVLEQPTKQDDRKVAFIIYVTHEMYERECLAWLARLEIPNGYSVEFFTVPDAADMSAAYEEARRASNAKFKIYLEDRTFVINRFFIRELLTIFESDSTIGAAGVWGVKIDSDRGIGKIIFSDSQGTRLLSSEKMVDVSGDIYDVAAFLGEGLFATQFDLDWTEQKGIGEQSLLYQEHGYKVVVARQRSAWCLLDQEREEDVLSCLKEIAKREVERGRGSSLIEQEDVQAWYLRTKFQLRRIEYHFPKEDVRELLDALLCGKVSSEALAVMGTRELLHNRRVMSYIKSSLMTPQVCEADGTLSAAENRVLHVASSLNRKYVRYVCVMLESLCRWNADVEIHAWLLHGELNESDKILIRRALAGRRITIDFLYVDKSGFERCRTTDMWSVEAYFRLQMLDLLPSGVDRLLYLDVDTLVLKPIYDLYYADFEGMDLIGCRDMGSSIPFGDVRDELFADYLDHSDFAYCNSGVMLWNVAKLRGKISFQDYIKAMEEREYRLLAIDQDVINLVHAGNVKLVEAERYDFFARPMLYIADCEEIKSHVSILHYSGSKPWDGRLPKVEVDVLWWEVARDMPFYTSLLEDMLRDSFQRDVHKDWTK